MWECFTLRKFPGKFDADGAGCVFYGTYLEPFHIQQLHRQLLLLKKKRSSSSSQGVVLLKRLCLISCVVADSTDQAFARKLATLLIGNPQIESLFLTGPFLLETNRDAVVLLRALPAVTSLKELCFCLGCPMNHDTALALGSLLMSNQNITRLYLAGISFRHGHVLEQLVYHGLYQAATQHQVEFLDLSACSIGDNAFHSFVDAIVHCSGNCSTSRDGRRESRRQPLQSLLLRRNHLSSKSLASLTKLLSLPFSSQLKNIDLQSMFLFVTPTNNDTNSNTAEYHHHQQYQQQHHQQQHVQEFFQILTIHPHLENVSLTCCGIDKRTVMSLLQTLAHSDSRIKQIDLRNNPWLVEHTDTMTILGPFLPHLKRLEALILGSCPLEKFDSSNSLETTMTKSAHDDDDNTTTTTTTTTILETDWGAGCCCCREFLFSLSQNSSLINLDIPEGSRQLLLASATARKKEGSQPLILTCLSQAAGVLKRNWMNQRLEQSFHKIPPLAVWPQFISLRLAKNANLYHGHSLVFQLLKVINPLSV